jgi:hypothetical protein
MVSYKPNKSFILDWIYDRTPQCGPVDQGKIATLAFGLAEQAVQPEW